MKLDLDQIRDMLTRGATSVEIAEETGIKLSTLRRGLQDLRAAGKLVVVGPTYSAYWCFPEVVEQVRAWVKDKQIRGIMAREQLTYEGAKRKLERQPRNRKTYLERVDNEVDERKVVVRSAADVKAEKRGPSSVWDLA